MVRDQMSPVSRWWTRTRPGSTIHSSRELSAQLEGIYGLLPSGEIRPANGYPALKALPEAAETRRQLEHLIADETAAGLKPDEAREKLVKEVAFTWLNRLVAFRMMEARGLIRQSVAKGPDSNGFKLWLTEPGNEEHLKRYEAGALPQDARGEGPRDIAYRAYLLHRCTLIAAEIRVLFDPDNLLRSLIAPTLAPSSLQSWHCAASAWLTPSISGGAQRRPLHADVRQLTSHRSNPSRRA